MCVSEPSLGLGTKEAKLECVNQMWDYSHSPSLHRQDAKMLNLVLWISLRLFSLSFRLNTNVNNNNNNSVQ